MPPSTALDVLILSNGPGEVLTWVHPVVKQLRQQLPFARISIALNPCPHASGHESHWATELIQADRVLNPNDFKPFLLKGVTPDNWTWHPRGVVLFLGGDPLFAWVIGRRLQYKSIVYTEKVCRWLSMNSLFLSLQPKVTARTLFPFLKHKIHCVGDLLQDTLHLASSPLQFGWQPLKNPDRSHYQISLLPGSKPLKLKFMLPYCLSLAQALQQQLPSVSLVLFVPPLFDLSELQDYITTPLVFKNELSATGKLITTPQQAHIETQNGTRIEIHQSHPAFNQLAASDLAITTIGTITNELGKLGTPMLVLSPLMLPELSPERLPQTSANTATKGHETANALKHIAQQSTIGRILTVRWIRALVLSLGNKWAPRFAWPNQYLKKEVVPEIRAGLTPQQLAPQVIALLQDTEKLNTMRRDLQAMQTPPGAAKKVVDWVIRLVNAPS